MISSLDRLIASSKAKPYIWYDNTYAPHNQLTFSKNLHPIHEGLPFEMKKKPTDVRFQQKIPDNEPIGDQDKTRRERRIEQLTNEVIFKANQSNPRTIKSNK